MVKRCMICCHKLDEDGHCINENCPHCTLTKIFKAAEENKEKADQADAAENK